MHLTVEEFAYGFAHFFEWRASTAMYITCWKGCFLITKALALPAAASSFPDLQDTKSLNIDTILNTTLVGDDLPYGPPIFTVDIDDAVSATGNHNRLEFEYEHIDGPMDQGAIFMGSIGAIFKVAGETGYDFDLFAVAVYVRDADTGDCGGGEVCGGEECVAGVDRKGVCWWGEGCEWGVD
ncbi:MAG: hypothetical protein L6R38_001967 [Xanthoria sp. 2 TBL-2021]|nr:MAG: hypothetical protein L6R38_001967 [Xanthoria sp. 2 TBL-2021]